MGYEEYPAHPALQDWVKCFWSIVDPSSDDVQEVWPDGCLELIFNPGKTFHVREDGSSEPFPRVFVMGLQTGIMRVRAEGEVCLLGARLLPFALREWQSAELETLMDEVEPLLRNAGFREAVSIVEAWLMKQPPTEDTLTSALRAVYDRSGKLSIAELAAAQGVSSRHLQRAFAARLGVSPKTLARIVRFAQSWSTILRRPEMTLAELALELGYSDQAHFSNEFRSFGGQSPQGFRRQRRRL